MAFMQFDGFASIVQPPGVRITLNLGVFDPANGGAANAQRLENNTLSIQATMNGQQYIREWVIPEEINYGVQNTVLQNGQIVVRINTNQAAALNNILNQ